MVIKRFGKIKLCSKPLKPSDSKAAPAKKADDDMDDLFGDDDAAPAPKVKVAIKKKKKEVIAMSLVMLEVKPLDSETSLDELAKRIFTLT